MEGCKASIVNQAMSLFRLDLKRKNAQLYQILFLPFGMHYNLFILISNLFKYTIIG